MGCSPGAFEALKRAHFSSESVLCPNQAHPARWSLRRRKVQMLETGYRFYRDVYRDAT